MLKARDPLIPGSTIILNGESYIMPPLTLGQWVRLADMRKKMDTGSDPNNPMSQEWIDANCALIHAALSRNYPDLRVEDLPDMIDLGNLTEIRDAMFALNKLKAAAAVDVKANGALPLGASVN
jgi:hypothetical protein